MTTPSTSPEPTPGAPKAAPVGSAAPASGGRAGRNLPAAISVGVGLVVVVVATLLWWHFGFVLLAAAALSLGAVEVHHAVGRLGMKSAIIPIVVGTIAICVGPYLAGLHPEQGISSSTLLLGALCLTVLAALVWRIPGGSDGFVRDAASSLFIIAYIPLLGSSTALMLADDRGPWRIVAFLFCVVASDTGGYLFGVLFGKHQMAPRISPKKTWEGLAGSVILGMVVGALSAVFLLKADVWVGLLLGAALVGFGTCGDLIESLIKRDVGIKDMSSFLPGHGGVMDRLDSLLIAAPVAWLIMNLFVPAG